MFLTVRSFKRGGFSFRHNLWAKNRDSAHRFYGLRDAQNRSSQFKSLRIKKKSESSGILRQKLRFGGWTIIVGRGGAGLGSAVEIGSPVPVPGRYQVPILYCITYCTVNIIILSLVIGSVPGLENCR